MVNRIFPRQADNTFGEQLARRFIVQDYAVVRTEGIPAGRYVTFGLLALLTLGLVLSLIPPRQRNR